MIFSVHVRSNSCSGSQNTYTYYRVRIKSALYERSQPYWSKVAGVGELYSLAFKIFGTLLPMYTFM